MIFSAVVFPLFQYKINFLDFPLIVLFLSYLQPFLCEILHIRIFIRILHLELGWDSTCALGWCFISCFCGTTL